MCWLFRSLRKCYRSPISTIARLSNVIVALSLIYSQHYKTIYNYLKKTLFYDVTKRYYYFSDRKSENNLEPTLQCSNLMLI